MESAAGIKQDNFVFFILQNFNVGFLLFLTTFEIINLINSQTSIKTKDKSLKIKILKVVYKCLTFVLLLLSFYFCLLSSA